MMQPSHGPEPRRPASMEDWQAVPAPYVAHLVDGELYVLPKPLPRHAMAVGGLLDTLMGPFHRGRGGPGGWLLLAEVDLRVNRNIVAPDLAGWRREQMPSVPEETPIELVPEWVCEVLSPSTETFDRGVKATWYASVGVRWLWLIDPEHKSLECHANEAGIWRPRGTWHHQEAVTAPPFDHLTWQLDQLWQ